MPQINLMELAEQSFGTSLEQLDDLSLIHI